MQCVVCYQRLSACWAGNFSVHLSSSGEKHDRMQVFLWQLFTGVTNSSPLQILRYRVINQEIKILEYCCLWMAKVMNNTVGEGLSWLTEFSLLLLQAAVSRNSLWKVESTILKKGQFSSIPLFQKWPCSVFLLFWWLENIWFLLHIYSWLHYNLFSSSALLLQYNVSFSRINFSQIGRKKHHIFLLKVVLQDRRQVTLDPLVD